ncbi:MAG: motility protein A, partial [Spirochaetales bacterium]|nr:motility protein A [Spirochaetales bacterium]
MDLGFIIGMPLGFVAIIAAILVGGFPLSIFMDLVSVIITVVGSFCALMVSSSLKDVLKMPTYFGIALKEPKSNIGELI